MSDRLLRIIRGDDRSASAALTRLGLASLSPAYRLAVAVRNAAYDRGIVSAETLPRPAISIGNITVGGAGKTPMGIEIARRLRDRGSRPAVLLRGYRSDQTQGSDEAAVYAHALGDGVPIVANPDRTAGASVALQQSAEVDVFILDDAFQHRRVQRDLDLVLIDATAPFGGVRLLPAGLLREPLANLARADAVVVTRCDLVEADHLAGIDRTIEVHHGQPPVAHVAARWTHLLDADDREHPTDAIADRTVLAVAGLGNPVQFRRQLQAVADPDSPALTFPDHHAYTKLDLGAIAAQAREAGAAAIVTTEKDWVKWQPLIETPFDVPVYRPQLAMRFLDGEDVFDAMLDELVAAS